MTLTGKPAYTGIQVAKVVATSLGLAFTKTAAISPSGLALDEGSNRIGRNLH